MSQRGGGNPQRQGQGRGRGGQQQYAGAPGQQGRGRGRGQPQQQQVPAASATGWSSPPPADFNAPVPVQVQQIPGGRGGGKKKGPVGAAPPGFSPAPVPQARDPGLAPPGFPSLGDVTVQPIAPKKKAQGGAPPGFVAPVSVERMTISSPPPVEPQLEPQAAASGSGGGGKKKKGKAAASASPPQASADPDIVQCSPEIRFAGAKMSDFPARPDSGGTIGRQIELFHNCFELKFDDTVLHAYRLTIEKVWRMKLDGSVGPQMTRVRDREKRDYSQAIVKRLPKDVVHDGFEFLWAKTPLAGITDERTERELIIDDPDKGSDIKLLYTLMRTHEINTTELSHYTRNKLSISQYPQEAIRLLDCIFRAVCGETRVNLGRNAYFDFKQPAKVIGMLTVYRGFFTSVRPQWKIRVNMDMTVKGFLTPGNVADVLYSAYRDELYDRNRWAEIYGKMKGVRVRTNYSTVSKPDGTPIFREFTVFGHSTEPANALKIPETNKTVEKYFQEDRKIKLNYADLPCLKLSRDRDVYVPLELLDIKPFQSPRDQQAKVVSEVIRCSAVPPDQRFREIDQYAKSILQTHALMAQYGLAINTDEKSRKVNGRILPAPTLNNGTQKINETGVWQVNAFRQPATRPQNQAIKWVIISLYPHNQQAISAVEGFAREGKRKGVAAIEERAVNVDRNSRNPDDVKRALEQYSNAGVSLAVIILNNSDRFYAEIKKFGDQLNGIVTQCVKTQTLMRQGVLSNLWLKVNGKLGGVNWAIDSLLPQILGDRRTANPVMAVGADVTHMAASGAGPDASQNKKSLAAVVASYTPDLMRYSVEITEQPTHEKGKKEVNETIANMDAIMKAHLMNFRQKNNDWPRKIIMFRDGVSEGQFSSVLVHELAGIQKACRECEVFPEPAITYIVVKKRHHIKIRPAPGPNNTNDRKGNMQPGTVVDREIVSPRDFDFFLCSHQGIQGTSKATHYYVLYDDNNFSSNDLQLFTYWLCYAYMRCTRSVSIPAPTYYSHLAAFRAREFLKASGRPEKEGQCNFFKIKNRPTMFYL